MKIALDSIEKTDLELIMRERRWPRFRGQQIYHWIYGKYARSFDEMTNLSKEMRLFLEQNDSLSSLEIIKTQISKEENTVKWLSQLQDGAQIETVLMKHSFGNSLCISSQAGCAMGCSFCASTLNGLERNLTSGELFSQIRLAQLYLQGSSEKLDNLVLMGTGEPFQNLENVLVFLKNLHDPEGGNFGYRRITISTCGLLPGIQRLMSEEIPVNLAISLHAPNNDLRSQIMPINHTYPIEELIACAQAYAEKTGRRITYEYLLLEDINDGSQEAKELVQLLRGKLASVNLIPYNPVPERPYRRPTDLKIQHFFSILQKSGIPTSIRREMGKDIDAACGQLRFQSISKEEASACTDLV